MPDCCSDWYCTLVEALHSTGRHVVLLSSYSIGCPCPVRLYIAALLHDRPSPYDWLMVIHLQPYTSTAVALAKCLTSSSSVINSISISQC